MHCGIPAIRYVLQDSIHLIQTTEFYPPKCTLPDSIHRIHTAEFLPPITYCRIPLPEYTRHNIIHRIHIAEFRPLDGRYAPFTWYIIWDSIHGIHTTWLHPLHTHCWIPSTEYTLHEIIHRIPTIGFLSPNTHHPIHRRQEIGYQPWDTYHEIASIGYTLKNSIHRIHTTKFHPPDTHYRIPSTWYSL